VKDRIGSSCSSHAILWWLGRAERAARSLPDSARRERLLDLCASETSSHAERNEVKRTLTKLYHFILMWQ
jgi:hypothetical protein